MLAAGPRIALSHAAGLSHGRIRATPIARCVARTEGAIAAARLLSMAHISAPQAHTGVWAALGAPQWNRGAANRPSGRGKVGDTEAEGGTDLPFHQRISVLNNISKCKLISNARQLRGPRKASPVRAQPSTRAGAVADAAARHCRDTCSTPPRTRSRSCH